MHSTRSEAGTSWCHCHRHIVQFVVSLPQNYQEVSQTDMKVWRELLLPICVSFKLQGCLPGEKGFQDASAACRLDSECKHWMDGGSFRGEMSEVVWDEDGDIEKLPTRPATWSPPVPSSTHRSAALTRPYTNKVLSSCLHLRLWISLIHDATYNYDGHDCLALLCTQ